MTESTTREMVKLRIADGESTETVWAVPLTENTFVLRNLPFFVYGYAFDDVVYAEKASDEFPTAVRVVTRSGHSTYRVFLTGATTSIEDVPNWQALREIGCTFERGTENLYAVDIPPTSDIHQAYAALELGESSGFWRFEEGFCGHVTKH